MNQLIIDMVDYIDYVFENILKLFENNIEYMVDYDGYIDHIIGQVHR